jgi:hypothetical protein
MAVMGGATLPWLAAPVPIIAASAARSIPAWPPLLAVRGWCTLPPPLCCRPPPCCWVEFPLGCRDPLCGTLPLGCLIGCWGGLPLGCRLPDWGGGKPLWSLIPGGALLCGGGGSWARRWAGSSCPNGGMLGAAAGSPCNFLTRQLFCWMRSIKVVKASGSQCQSRKSQQSWVRSSVVDPDPPGSAFI